MRYLGLVAGLIVWACTAWALEVEEVAVFSGTPGGRELQILSTTDTEAFAPLIAAYQAAYPDVSVRYTVAGSQEVYAAIYDEGLAFDLVVSSAMDLQMKLANDGFGLTHRSVATQALPVWARWADQLFAFAQEPVVMIVNRAGFEGLPMPRTREDLIRLMRENPDRFRGRIGTYDPMLSGAGYLFATQDARQSDTIWRLAEVMGALDPKLFGSTGAMIDGVKSGDLLLAYNVVGSYAAARLGPDSPGQVIEAQDFTHVLLRTALIPQNAGSPDLGAAFLDFLLSEAGQRLTEAETGLPRIDETALAASPHLRPIRLDLGLLVFVDPLMRKRFLSEWRAAVLQP